MAINIYEDVAKVAEIFQPDRLPHVRLPANQASRPGLRNPQIGATRPSNEPQVPPPPYVDVVGQPSVQLKRLPTGGIEVVVRRKSVYAEYIPESDIATIKAIANRILAGEKELSRGPLSYKDLRRKNHPYGRGPIGSRGHRRGLGRLTQIRGVSNRAIVNKHTGEFERAWEVEVGRDKGGVTIRLINRLEVAEWLAFGTPLMVGHGGFVTAVVRELSALNAAWAGAAKRGYHQQMALRGFEGG